MHDLQGPEVSARAPLHIQRVPFGRHYLPLLFRQAPIHPNLRRIGRTHRIVRSVHRQLGRRCRRRSRQHGCLDRAHRLGRGSGGHRDGVRAAGRERSAGWRTGRTAKARAGMCMGDQRHADAEHLGYRQGEHQLLTQLARCSSIDDRYFHSSTRSWRRQTASSPTATNRRGRPTTSSMHAMHSSPASPVSQMASCCLPARPSESLHQRLTRMSFYQRSSPLCRSPHSGGIAIIHAPSPTTPSKQAGAATGSWSLLGLFPAAEQVAEAAGGKAHSDIVRCFDLDVGTQTVTTGGEDGRVCIWNLADAQSDSAAMRSSLPAMASAEGVASRVASGSGGARDRNSPLGAQSRNRYKPYG